MAEARLKGEELPKPEGLLTQNENCGNRSTLATSHFRRVAWVFRQRRSARHPAPREMFRRTAVRIDIRQESTRHTEALGELTATSVSATTKAGQRPTNRRSCPRTEFQTSAATAQLATKRRTREVLDTCQVIAEAPQGSIAPT